MSPRAPRLSVLLALFGTACSDSGEVLLDAASFTQVASAWFVEVGTYVPLADAYMVYLSSFDDGCTTHADYWETVNHLGTSDDDMVEAWTVLPERFDIVSLTLLIDGQGTDPAGEVLWGPAWDEWPDTAGQFRATIYRYAHTLTLEDVAALEADEDVSEWRRTWLSDGGELEVDRYWEETWISGSVTAALVEEAGDAAGDLEISFAAEHCPELEAAWD